MPRHVIAVLAAAAVAVLASAPAEARKSRGSSASRPPVASPPVANPAPVANPVAVPAASAARSNSAVPTSRPRPVMLFSIGSASAAPVAAAGEEEERARAGRISPSAPRPTLARDAAPAGPLPPVLGSGEVAAPPLGGFAAVVPEGPGRFAPLQP